NYGADRVDAERANQPGDLVAGKLAIPPHLIQPAQRLRRQMSRLAAVAAHEGVIYIDNNDNMTERRERRPRASFWETRAVKPFMMLQDNAEGAFGKVFV